MKFSVLNKAFQDKMKVLSGFISSEGLGSYVEIRTIKSYKDGKDTDAILIKLENTVKSCEIRVFCKVEENGEIFLSYNQLLSVLGSTTDAKTITFSEKEDEIEIYSTDENMNFSFTIKSIKLQSEPIEWKTSHSFYFHGNILSYMISTTLPFVSNDDSRINMCGIRMEKKDKGLIMKATDGKRAVLLFPKEGEQDIPDFPPITIPSKFAKTISKNFSSFKGNIKIMISPNCLMIKSEEITMAGTLLREEFPNIERLIPKKTNETLYVNSSLLLKAVKRASVCAEKSRAIFLDLDTNMVTVRAENLKTMSDEIEAHYSGVSTTIVFDYKYLQDLLMVYNGEVIPFKIIDSQSKVIAEDNNGVFIVMPRQETK